MRRRENEHHDKRFHIKEKARLHNALMPELAVLDVSMRMNGGASITIFRS